jgi:hypothetical protein
MQHSQRMIKDIFVFNSHTETDKKSRGTLWSSHFSRCFNTSDTRYRCVGCRASSMSNDAAMRTVGSHRIGHIQTPDSVPDLRDMSITFRCVDQLSSPHIRRRRPDWHDASDLAQTACQQQQRSVQSISHDGLRANRQVAVSFAQFLGDTIIHRLSTCDRYILKPAQ